MKLCARPSTKPPFLNRLQVEEDLSWRLLRYAPRSWILRAFYGPKAEMAGDKRRKANAKKSENGRNSTVGGGPTHEPLLRWQRTGPGSVPSLRWEVHVDVSDPLGQKCPPARQLYDYLQVHGDSDNRFDLQR